MTGSGAVRSSPSVGDGNFRHWNKSISQKEYKKNTKKKRKWENVRRRVKGDAAQVDVKGDPERSVHCGVLAE